MHSQVQYNSTGHICVLHLGHLTFALYFHDASGLHEVVQSHPALVFSRLTDCICQRLIAKQHNLLISSVDFKYMIEL